MDRFAESSGRSSAGSIAANRARLGIAILSEVLRPILGRLHCGDVSGVPVWYSGAESSGRSSAGSIAAS